MTEEQADRLANWLAHRYPDVSFTIYLMEDDSYMVMEELPHGRIFISYSKMTYKQ
jgi:hypothetical protein